MEYRDARFRLTCADSLPDFFYTIIFVEWRKKGPLAPEGGKTIPKGRVARDFMSFGLSFLSVKFLQ